VGGEAGAAAATVTTMTNEARLMTTKLCNEPLAAPAESAEPALQVHIDWQNYLTTVAFAERSLFLNLGAILSRSANDMHAEVPVIAQLCPFLKWGRKATEVPSCMVVGQLQRTDELGRIVRINGEIRSVVRIAFSTSVMALNALVMARKAGQLALGFGVLSNEIRVFSRSLDGCMKRMKLLNDRSVETVSLLLKLQGRLRVFQLASAAITASKADPSLIVGVLHRQEEQIDSCRSQLQKLTKDLRATLSDASTLLLMGAMLAQGAKIEAVYGGEHAQALSQVAAEFGVTVDRIVASVATLSVETK
jgi:hypothetical protein